MTRRPFVLKPAHFTAVLLAASVALNITLAWRVQSLRNMVGLIASANAIKAGSIVRPVELADIGGKPLLLDYGANVVPTLVYVMSPDCAWCQRNMANMEALIHQAGPTYKMVIASVTNKGVAEYRLKHNIEMEISVLPIEGATSLGVGGTPATVLISPQGKVLGKWDGAFREGAIREIQSQLKIRLPGPAWGGTDDKGFTSTRG